MTLSAKTSLMLGVHKAGFRREGHNLWFNFRAYTINSICSIMITIFTHIKFSRIYSPARNARKYVLRENFYGYSR